MILLCSDWELKKVGRRAANRYEKYLGLPINNQRLLSKDETYQHNDQ
jgi:hypothetical protein